MMTSGLAILDFSIHGNAIDAESDRLLAAAARAEGIEATISTIAPSQPRAAEPHASEGLLLRPHGGPAASFQPSALSCQPQDFSARCKEVSEKDSIRIGVERVWLRYDLRSRAELSWMVAVAHDLRRRGHRVFPQATSILLAEDKWETVRAFRERGISTPETLLALDIDRCRLPAMLKPRVGWGGLGSRVLRDASDLRSADAIVAEDFICQPYIPHCRTSIVAVANGRETVVIEERREPERDGEAQVRPLPPGADGLAAAAVEAVRLPAGTADLIETGGCLSVLEVNSAPRIAYPNVPDAELATPLVRAVLSWMENPGH
ncbi:MAG: ATP-grasp domain-containing protein [Planctomycetota bacterium]